MLALTLLWPKYFYPLVWGAVFLILEPLNIARRRRHLFTWLKDGDWRPVISLSVGALICGFFWEMWNHFSYPKWIKGDFKEMCFDARPHLLSSPPGEEMAAGGSGFADECPANPVARIFKGTANDSPSPWGEGRDEGARESILQMPLLG